MNNGFYAKLALEGYSVIPIGEDKRPIGTWKEYQTKHRTTEEVNNSSFKKWGIITGYQDLECIDVDLKVFSTTKEKVDFWNELTSLLKNAIFDFDNKFVVYKTQNAGYHILYKSKRVQPNLKLASLKGHKEAVVETRGTGGMIAIYKDNQVSKKSYFEIEYISDEDRESLMRICKSFHYEEPKNDVVKPKIKKEYNNDGEAPWEDFNNQTDVWSVVSDEFVVVKDTPKRIFIKRHGATSAHSGYIYKDDNLMYLFSTGTIYPHETQLSPYACYTYKYHNGDFSKSAKDLYEQGFGSRIVKVEQTPEPRELIKIDPDKLIFPIEVFPKPIQNYIVECHETLDSSIDYLGSALLWVLSICIGNSMVVQPKRGWREICSLWIAVVGKPGIGKTPSLKNMIFPLQNLNSKKIKEFFKKYKEFEEYDRLTKKEKEEVVGVEKPVKTQFIANDITIEALFDLHQESDNAVGVFKDELVGWFNDMNKYTEGSDKQTWLSTWSGESVNLNRMTRAGSFVSKPFLPVLGGIQPKILDTLFTDENKDSGFMDRVLLSYPDLEISETYNDNEMSYEAIQWYSDTIISFYETNISSKRIQRDSEGEIVPHVITFDDEAKEEWKRINIKISKYQNSPDENEYMKSMYPKQAAYTARFALIIHAFKCHMENKMDKIAKIDKDSMLKGEKLSEYFINMSKKVKIDSQEFNDIKATAKHGKVLSAKEKFESIYKANPDANVKRVAEVLGVSTAAIYKYKKELEAKNKK